MSLALWLRAGRADRGLSLDDVARVTKIQPRILERLEAGKLDGLPAEVFVRGFVRSVAKCCGLDEAEALRRYAAAASGVTTTAPAASAPARAVVEAMADLAPQAARAIPPRMAAPAELVEPVVEHVFAEGSLPGIVVAPVEISEAVAIAETAEPETPMAEAAEPAETVRTTSSPTTQSQKPRKKRRGGKRAKRKSLATGTPASPVAVVASPAEPALEPEPVATLPAEPVDGPLPAPVDHLDPLVVPPDDGSEDVIATETWQPKMPPPAAPSAPWRRPYVAAAMPAVPTLVIDDADPESAEQVLEERRAAKVVSHRSFLPPILLDREDRSARQGGLTLAVIILLIAATLTLSYLMRRPSSSGDGITQATTELDLVG